MPVTVNAPNFWDLTLDNFINRSDRNAESDRSYLFNRPVEDNTKIDPYKRQNFLPPEDIGTDNQNEIYNNIMDSMEIEAKKGTIPYNTAPIKQGNNPDILEAIQQWILNKGSTRK